MDLTEQLQTIKGVCGDCYHDPICEKREPEKCASMREALVRKGLCTWEDFYDNQ